jgi:signal transduction histidine kinase
MNIDVAGRVRNVQLPATKPLLPLFEAVINSIHAVEDAQERNGRIEVEVFRTVESSLPHLERPYADVTGFSVRDNGVGFDEQNFEAFVTSDTTYKASRGGKGIGRFMWLAAFEHTEIESVFRSNGQMKRRRFTFCARG